MIIYWKKLLIFLAITMSLAVNPILAEPRNSINKHDKIVHIFGGGGIFGPWGDVIDKEEELSSIATQVSYIDGSSKKTYLSYTFLKAGIVGEYVVSDSIGIQLGYVFNGLTQASRVGGGNYEQYRVGEERTLLTIRDVFLGANWYFYNTPSGNVFLLGRIGLVRDGKIYPHVNNFERLGNLTGSYDGLKGYNFSVGIGGSHFFGRKLFVGTTVDFDHNIFSMTEEIPGYNTKTFSLEVITWSLTLGVRL